MAYALHIYTSTTSGQVDFQFTFPYIKAEHVKLYVNYTEIAYAVATRGAGVAGFQVYTAGGNTYARLNDTNGLGSANTRVEVRRISSLASVLVDYADGSTLVASDLDTSNLQHLYVSQEVDDALKQGVAIDPATGLPTLGSQRLTNVANPTAAQDAATKNYVDTAAQPVDAELTELATMSSGTAAALADLTAAEVQAIDGVTSSTNELNILDGVTASTAEINKLDGVTASTAELNLVDGVTATTTELNLLDGVTATTAEINYVDGVTSNVQTQLDAKQPLDAELTELATMSSDTAAALADLTQAEVQLVDGATLTTTELNYVDGVTSAIQTQIDGKQPLDADLTSLSSCQSGAAVNLALLTSGEVAVLDGATLSTAELNTLTGITSTAAELNKLDGVTSTTANLNVVSGMTKATTLTSNSDTEFPTSKAVNDRILTVTNALGGFVAIANETSFPAANPDPSNGAGTVVSVSDAGGVVVNGSGVASITNGAGTGNTVTINGFPSALQSKTLASGIGLQVQTTTTLHTYTYHKVLAKEADVEQLSDDINDFNNRYRVVDSLPNSNNDEGDLVYNKATDKMMVYDSTTSQFKEVQSIGSFNFNTLSSYNGTGGNSASFNGSAYRFILSNPPSFAQQLICSVNGVIQKPNTGTSQPSEGFAIDGSSIIFSAAPASNAPFFAITLGSTVNIGTVSDGTVTEAKLSVGNDPTNGKFLQAQSGQTGGMLWADVPAGVGGANGVDFNDDVNVQFGTNTDGLIRYYNSGLNAYTGGQSGAQWVFSSQNTGGTDTTPIRFYSRSNVGGNAVYSQYAVMSPTNKDVALFYNGNQKFITTNTGVTVTGTVAATAFSGDGSALTGIASTSLDGCGYQNDQTIAAGTYSIAANKGMHSVGPITNNGTVTVSGTWVIS